MGDRLDPKIDMALDDVIMTTRSPSHRHEGRSRYSGSSSHRKHHHRDQHQHRSSDHASQRRVQGGRISVPARSVGQPSISTDMVVVERDPIRSSLSVSNLHHEVTEDDLAVLEFTIFSDP